LNNVNYVKKIDTWTERIFCEIVATKITNILIKIIKDKKLPYYMTFLSFLLRIMAAGLFFTGYNLYGAIIFYFSMVTDCVDGMCSRAIYGKDPETRGTLDVTFDTIGLQNIVLCRLILL